MLVYWLQRGTRMMRASCALLLGGCVQIFDLHDPVQQPQTLLDAGIDAMVASAADASIDAIDPRCPGGAIAGGSCFERFTGKVVWQTARSQCVARGGALAKIEATDVFDTVATLIPPGEPAYIGASDDVGHRYEWVDGTRVLYAGWLPNQPDSIHECVVMQSAPAAGWDDVSCQVAYDYICERKLVGE